MKRYTIAFRPESGKKKKVHVDQWQIDHIREGIRQADAGDFATKAQVVSAFARPSKLRSTQN